MQLVVFVYYCRASFSASRRQVHDRPSTEGVKDHPGERQTYPTSARAATTSARALGRRIARSQAAGSRHAATTRDTCGVCWATFSQLSAGHVIEVVKQEATKTL